MRKYIFLFIMFIAVIAAALYAFDYYVPYSEGVRAGKLVKFSRKGVLIKTYEGQLSYGVGHDQLWDFSVEDKDALVIEKMNDYQGKTIKIKYIERFWGVFWLGKTKYFAKEIVLDNNANTQ